MRIAMPRYARVPYPFFTIVTSPRFDTAQVRTIQMTVQTLSLNVSSDHRPPSFAHFLLAVAHLLSLIHISEPTRLGMISYAVFCLKKKKKTKNSEIFQLKTKFKKKNKKK